MSLRAITTVWENCTHSGTALLTMLAIADYANDSLLAWPSVGSIARKTRMSPRNVQLMLRKLKNSGSLEEHGKSRMGCVVYRIKVPDKPLNPEPNSDDEWGDDPMKTFSGGGRKRFQGGGEDVFRGGVKTFSPDPSLEPSVTPKGVTTPEPPVSEKPAKEVSSHRRFTDLWGDRYLAHHGEQYMFSGAKDGAAVKSLLTGTGKTPEQLVALAESAWKLKTFHCLKAVSIAGFRGYYNEILRDVSQYREMAPTLEQVQSEVLKNIPVYFPQLASMGRTELMQPEIQIAITKAHGEMSCTTSQGCWMWGRNRVTDFRNPIRVKLNEADTALASKIRARQGQPI